MTNNNHHHRLQKTPFPDILDLREWDKILLNRFKPKYSVASEKCNLCALGPCSLSNEEKGVCGIAIEDHTARAVLLNTLLGAAAHCSHADELLDDLISRFGEESPIVKCKNLRITAPISRVVCGISPVRLKDLIKITQYIQEQLIHLLASVSFGTEAKRFDFESKSLHAGMLDNLALEVSDLAQISAYSFKLGPEESSLEPSEIRKIVRTKPTILCVGHNLVSGIEISEYIKQNKLRENVEFFGLCCMSSDTLRGCGEIKLIGNLNQQKKFVRSGIADVILVDKQCVRADILQDAKSQGTILICVSETSCFALPNLTNFSEEEIVSKTINSNYYGAVVDDKRKAAAVAVKIAEKIHRERAKENLPKIFTNISELVEESSNCIECGNCSEVCPIGIPVDKIMESLKSGDIEEMIEAEIKCIGCGLCSQSCSEEIPIFDMIISAGWLDRGGDRFLFRVGRGPILENEIKNIAPSIVMGNIPGIICFAGCPSYLNGYKDVIKMAEIFIKENYIVAASGCVAIDIARETAENENLYKSFLPNFDAGGLINLGSCVSGCHAIGAAIKIAEVILKRDIDGNFAEIADFLLNKVGTTMIAWGGTTQKALSIATGANRWGIPVIFGKLGKNFNRQLLGKEKNPEIWDRKSGKKVKIGPAPENLFMSCDTKEEAISWAAKLCIRPNDTTAGRKTKLSKYVKFYKQKHKKLPDDLKFLIRTEFDIPEKEADKIMNLLSKSDWQPTFIPDPKSLM